MAVLKRKQIKLYVHRTMYILHIDALENDVAIEKQYYTLHTTVYVFLFWQKNDCFGKILYLAGGEAGRKELIELIFYIQGPG